MTTEINYYYYYYYNISDEGNGTVSKLVVDSGTQAALEISEPDTLPLPTVHCANYQEQNSLNVNDVDNNRMEVSENDSNSVNIHVDNSVLRQLDMETDQSTENFQVQKELNHDTTNTDSGIDISPFENVQNSESECNMQEAAQTIPNTTAMDGETGEMDTGTHISTCDNLENTEPSPDITLQNVEKTTTDINNITADSGNIDSGIDMSISESLQSNERPVGMPVPDGSETSADVDNNIGEVQNNDLPKIQAKVSEASEDDES